MSAVNSLTAGADMLFNTTLEVGVALPLQLLEACQTHEWDVYSEASVLVPAGIV
jgi:hypothetical protein